ncbi:MAG: AAA family ATPase, partial [Ignisphaera sp.]|nr:AAA family ATPase [Ignisphaera sp.]
MYEQIQNYEHKITFVIGFAGSGKSTHLANLCRENQTVVLTPTHRAADVLRDKGLMNVYTIHSVLKLVPTINMEFRKGQRLQTLRQIGSTDLSHITHIAIDEFSMISQELLDRLLSILPTSAHVYVYGDSTQLPPVDGTPIEPELYTDDIQRLVVQHRADNPEIVETFMRFHHYVESRKEMNLKVGLPRGTLEGFNPETDTILAYTNNRVIELNNIVATQLGLPDNISDGEDVLINGIDCVYHSMTHDTQPNNNMKRPNNNMTHDTQPSKPYNNYNMTHD